MFSFIGDIKEILAHVGDLLGAFGVGVKYGVFGAVVGTAAFLAGRIVKRFFGETAGFATVAITCALMIGGAAALDFYKDAQAARAAVQIKQLEAANAAKAAKIDELELTNAALNAFLNAEREADKKNAKVIADLEAMIAAQPDKPECALPDAFVNGLEKLE